MRHLAPSGTPVRAADLVRWAATAGSRDAAARLANQLSTRFDVRHVFLSSTGRAGMTLLLRAMASLRPGRDEVIVPAYTCYSVAASAVKAGLKVRIVDIVPETLDYEPGLLDAAPFDRVLAVVATNLYGLPGDLPGLQELAHRRGAFLIDDSAQAMGATVRGRPSGTWGDAGLFSFDKGKNVSAIDGGAVVTGDETLAAVLRAQFIELGVPRMAVSAVNVAKALSYAALLRPLLYGIPKGIPGLNLGQTTFTTDFPLERPSHALAALAATLLPRLQLFAAARSKNASAMRDGLRGLRGVSVVEPASGAVPADLRLPLIFDRPMTRDEALAAFAGAGIGATGSYPSSLADVAQLQPHLANPQPRASGARHVAARILTLPTHPYVRAADVTRMVAIVRDVTTPMAVDLPVRRAK